MDDKTDHDILIEIHTVLLGSAGAPGLVTQVRQCREECDTSLTTINKCLANFKLKVTLLIGFLTGLGILDVILLH